MPRQEKIKIIHTGLLEHPAVKALGELRLERVKPDRIEVLKEKKKSAVYRLKGVGPDGSAVIAKRSEQVKAALERTIYEEILPRLPIPSMQYYGFVKEDGRFWWLFLEDVGGLRYSPFAPGHRVLAAKWLGAMHATAEGMNVKVPLPSRGPAHYLMYLQATREALPQIRSFSSLKTADQELLKNIASLCEFLELHWGQVETFCDQIPRTFIHGDCLAKNVHVRTVRGELVLAPFDWAGAGWGLPATDLGQLGLPYHSLPSSVPDCATYLSAVRERWPDLDLRIVQQLTNLGQMFWSLKVISRSVPELDYKRTHIETVMNKFGVYRSVLTDTIRAARWEN